MEEKKKLRCPLGIPGGIIAALIGLIGVIVNIINFNWFELITSFALLLLALPFVRVTMMVHMANDRLDELENKLKTK
ncbi:MAG: holin-like protein [Bacteroidales bacterium]|nr:holin-like protein [Bacteroidales bacterium]